MQRASFLRIWFTGFLISVVPCIHSDATAGGGPCGDSVLPRAAQEVVARKYRGWVVVAHDNLSADDRKLWTEAWGQACPGVAAGSFTNSISVEYAVLLIQRTSSELRERLVVLKPLNGKYVSMEVYEGSTSRVAVVRREAAGVLKKWDDPHVTRAPRFDVIIHEVIEAGMIAFYSENGRFRRIQISG